MISAIDKLATLQQGPVQHPVLPNIKRMACKDKLRLPINLSMYCDKIFIRTSANKGTKQKDASVSQTFSCNQKKISLQFHTKAIVILLES